MMFQITHQIRSLDISDFTDAIPLMAWFSNDDPGCRWINKSWLEFCGFSTVDQFGRAWLSSIHPDDLDEFGRRISDAYRNRVPYAYRYLYRNKLGDYVLLHDRGYPRFHDDGTLAGFFGFCIDCCLFQSSQPIDKISEPYSALPVGVVVWDANLKVHQLNSAAEKLFATHSSAASGKCLSLVSGINRESLLRCFATLTTLEQGGRHSSVELLSDIPGNGLRSFEWHNSLFGDLENESQQVVSAVIDTTDRKLRLPISSTIEEQFDLATAKVNCMVYEWRHDSGIVSRSQGLLKLVGYSPEDLEPTIEAWEQLIHPEDVESFKAAFLQQIQAGRKLVDSHYRVFHRDGNIRYIWDRASINYDEKGEPQRISGFSTDVSDLMVAQQSLKQSEERFRVATESIEGMVYECDVSNNNVMRSVGIENITGFKALEVPIKMSWWVARIHHDDRMTYDFTFKDAIAHTLESVTIDYRLHHVTKGYIEVRDRCRILYSPNGKPIQIIGCVSPIVHTQSDVIGLPDSNEACISTTPAKEVQCGLRVLVVDDYPSSADSLGKLLQLLGHEADVTYDGGGAMQLINEREHDLVFLDIGLPKITGYDVARQIRTLRQDNVIIAALTGWGDAQSRSRSTDAGFDYHFTKPISDTDLDHVLQAAITKKAVP